MPFTVQEFGGLAVAFAPTDQKLIQRALTQLDDRLFLDPEVEPYGPRGSYVYMTVKHHVGSAVPPVTVLEWRDGMGPKPLTMAIVEQVKRQEGRMHGAVRAVIEANERLRQATVATVGDQAYEVGLDAKKASGKTSAVLPRSQALRMSRDKARAKGRKV